jgi:hypothetical protein
MVLVLEYLIAGAPHLRPLKRHWPAEAFPTFAPFVKQTHQTGVHLGRERVRGVCKKSTSATLVPLVAVLRTPPTVRRALSHARPARPRRVGARCVCFMQTPPS